MFWEKLEFLCSWKGETPAQVAKKCGYTSSIITTWRWGDEIDQSTKENISAYFGIPVAFFEEGKKKNAVPLTDAHITLAPIFKNLTEGITASDYTNAVDFNPIFFSRYPHAENILLAPMTGNTLYPMIDDGDMLFIEKQDNAENGQIVVCLIKGERPIVTQYFSSEKGIELRFVNTQYPPRWFRGEDANKVKIAGVVKKVIRDI